MTPEVCQEMIQWHKSHRHLTGVGDGSDYTGIRFMHIHAEWIRYEVAKIIVNLVGEIRKTSDQIVYPEMIAINEWPIGGIQHPHLDTYSNQEVNHGTSPDKPSREWTCILYLNDNYHGGRTYIPDGEVFEPETGSGLLFQGIYIPHGVQKVRRHPRQRFGNRGENETKPTGPFTSCDDVLNWQWGVSTAVFLASSAIRPIEPQRSDFIFKMF